MKHLSHFSEVDIGDTIYTVSDIFKFVGGPIYCLAGTHLIVTEKYEQALKACPEGGMGLAEPSRVSHLFTGTSALESLRLVSKKDLHLMQNDGGKDRKTNKTKK